MELGAEHRRGDEQLQERVIQQRQPPPDGVADARRDHVDRAGGVLQVRRLVHEEGVAAGPSVDLGDHPAQRLAACRPRHEHPDIVAVQPGQRHRGGPRAPVGYW
jgi:hypothetical protein